MDAVAAAGRDRGHFIFDSKGDGADKRKRKGAGDAGSGGAPLDAAKLRGMGYRHLQGLAKAQGLAATGSKKELLQRLLSACATAVAKDCDGEADEKAKKEKIVKATRRALQCWISTYLTI
ncbi:hypothetical protein PR202_gb20381 [Eleusine coracana subsp. coracana]|uniref:SAP domain-containing protein n=1 Tax=Eleusine coracana subsp. coracana TaxID=191504 RepID=A0AAV5FAL0_ELECO|nr:hypothetical protein PR202_gb20381 [Eleusine coracana subsp. coracana]